MSKFQSPTPDDFRLAYEWLGYIWVDPPGFWAPGASVRQASELLIPLERTDAGAEPCSTVDGCSRKQRLDAMYTQLRDLDPEQPMPATHAVFAVRAIMELQAMGVI